MRYLILKLFLICIFFMFSVDIVCGDIFDEKLYKVNANNNMEVLDRFETNIIERGDDYVIMLLSDKQRKELETLNFSLFTINESELTYRIIRVCIENQDDINKLANMGLDIWEIHSGCLIIRVVDRDI